MIPLHDQLMSEARFALQQAVACLDVPRLSVRDRYAARCDTAERVTAALDLLHRAELAVADADGPRGRP